jgi:AcrR family transcriptional regulator
MARPQGALDLRKRRAILDAAREAFREGGYGVSMDQIAQRAGVAKQTVYNHFHSKSDLVHALVDEVVSTFTATLEHAGDGPRAVLTEFGVSFLSQVLSPHVIGFHRLMAAEGAAFPELAAQAYEAGPKASRRKLAAYLAREARAGRLDVADPEQAAEIFFGMLIGQRHIKLMLQVGPRPSEADTARHVAECVRVFLAAYGNRADDGRAPDRA